MSKAFFKSNPKSKKYIYALGSLVVVLLIAVTYLYVSLYQLKESLLSYTNSQIMIDSYKEYEHDRLLFCYDHAVQPCTDESLWKWNSEHTNDSQFAVKSRQEVADKAAYIKDF